MSMKYSLIQQELLEPHDFPVVPSQAQQGISAPLIIHPVSPGAPNTSVPLTLHQANGLGQHNHFNKQHGLFCCSFVC